MTLNELLLRLENIRMKVDGSVTIKMCTETKETGQVEQDVEDLAYSERNNCIILLPENF